jgi:hypothetical protein
MGSTVFNTRSAVDQSMEAVQLASINQIVTSTLKIPSFIPSFLPLRTNLLLLWMFLLLLFSSHSCDGLRFALARFAHLAKHQRRMGAPQKHSVLQHLHA